jgi:hypothetical protein
MPWQYSQSQGIISRNGQVILGGGYAGNGLGLNNPEAQDQHNVGPLPQGHYLMTALVDSPKTGIATIILDPDPGTEMYGRSAFRIHGDNGRDDQSASDGCIVAGHAADRTAIWDTGDHDLEVTA